MRTFKTNDGMVTVKINGNLTTVTSIWPRYSDTFNVWDLEDYVSGILAVGFIEDTDDDFDDIYYQPE